MWSCLLNFEDFLDLIAFRYDFVRIVFVSDGCSLEDLIHKLFVYIFLVIVGFKTS